MQPRSVVGRRDEALGAEQPELFEDGELVPVLAERADAVTVELSHRDAMDARSDLKCPK